MTTPLLPSAFGTGRQPCYFVGQLTPALWPIPSKSALVLGPAGQRRLQRVSSRRLKTLVSPIGEAARIDRLDTIAERAPASFQFLWRHPARGDALLYKKAVKQKWL